MEVCSLAGTHVFWNIHNFGLTERKVKHVKKEILTDKRRCVADPASVAVFVMGDWNFLAQGERRKRLDRPELHAGGPSGDAGVYKRLFLRGVGRLH